MLFLVVWADFLVYRDDAFARVSEVKLDTTLLVAQFNLTAFNACGRLWSVGSCGMGRDCFQRLPAGVERRRHAIAMPCDECRYAKDGVSCRSSLPFPVGPLC